MKYPSPDFHQLIELLNLDKKQEVEKFCRNITIKNCDLIALILAAQENVLLPYKYVNYFYEKISKDSIIPITTPENKNDTFREVPKNIIYVQINRILNIMKTRKVFAAHLLYTPKYNYWHLFFFDNKDKANHKNHWKLGSHIHYVSYLWGNLKIENIWNQVLSGKISISSKLHIKYEKT